MLREALETHSARLFAESASPRFRKRLEAAATKLDVAYEALSRGQYSPAKHARVERVHIAFHMLIAEATGVPLLIQEIERSRVLLFNWICPMSSEFGAFPERWHRHLAERLVHGSPQKAAEAMRMHVRFRQADVIRKFQALAESGPGEQRMIRGPQRRNRAGDRASSMLL